MERAVLYQLGLLKEGRYYTIVEMYPVLWESYCDVTYYYGAVHIE